MLDGRRTGYQPREAQVSVRRKYLAHLFVHSFIRSLERLNSRVIVIILCALTKSRFYEARLCNNIPTYRFIYTHLIVSREVNLSVYNDRRV